jgi:16S rRNA (cytidine1402-2'-O)-methyltransferase
MLYLVSTPIGNLSDITPRALDILKASDYILCEDTRHSGHLMKHFEIDKPLYSLHQFNECQKSESIIQDLQAGKTIALVVDAGTPGICDPSGILVKRCHEENIKVVAPVGACAIISALSLYGLVNPNFQFLGFAPKKGPELNAFLQKARYFDGLSVFYDTPHQFSRTVDSLIALNVTQNLTVMREISKVYESIETLSLNAWKERLEQTPIRGELVVILEGEKKEAEQLDEEYIIQTLRQELDLSYNDLIKLAAKLLKKPKNALYQKWLET